jgi:branched-subunit amino acid aminotransferase/4-amino-4-deoxychorismate lyase
LSIDHIIATGELAGVTKIDNRTIGDGECGPMTKRLSQLYTEFWS